MANALAKVYEGVVSRNILSSTTYELAPDVAYEVGQAELKHNDGKHGHVAKLYTYSVSSHMTTSLAYFVYMKVSDFGEWIYGQKTVNRCLATYHRHQP